jgi:hypothetical protein
MARSEKNSAQREYTTLAAIVHSRIRLATHIGRMNYESEVVRVPVYLRVPVCRGCLYA